MKLLQTVFIKKTITTSIYTLLNIILFLQQQFLTNTYHIMVPEVRDFVKDSKKSSFALL